MTAIRTDSRRVRPGHLFVALAGERTDGRRYLDDAVRRGAVAVVTPDREGLAPDLPALVHPHPGRLLARMSARLYGHPARRLDLVGVTGTNGKTTTTLMVAAILRAAGRPTAHWTTTEVAWGGGRFRPYWTTPPPPDLHQFLAESAQAGARAAALEVSSHGIALGRLEGVRFAAGAVTNLSPDHLDFHGDFAHYEAAKRAFVLGLGRGATCLVNADDPRVRTFGRGARCRVLTFGTARNSDLRVSGITPRDASIEFRLEVGPTDLRRGGGRRLRVTLPMAGRHNALNAAAAAGMALSLGVDGRTVVDALERFEPPPRRLQARRVGPYAVVNDVAMNEGSYDAVLGAVADAHRGPVVVVHALRGHRGEEGNAAVAGVLARWNTRLGFAPLIVSLSEAEVSRLAADHRVRPSEAAAFATRCQAEGLAVDVRDRLADAIAVAVDRLPPGGLLLLLGTFGMDDGPALAERALCERAGLRPADLPVYLEPSYGPEEEA